MYDPYQSAKIKNRDHVFALLDEVTEKMDQSILKPYVDHHTTLEYMEVFNIMTGSGNTASVFQKFMAIVMMEKYITSDEGTVAILKFWEALTKSKCGE